jgi:L-methionine (R)-S-oxide reductase
MSEKLSIIEGTRQQIYAGLLPQIKALIGNENNQIANLANTTAALKEALQFLWIGFYLVQDNELILGPFQGPIACTRIQYGKGVCGLAWSTGSIQIVPDVDEFPGHIACSSLSKSEIVIPLLKNGRVIGVLDIDSIQPDDFGSIDQIYLTQLCSWLCERF